MDTTYLFQDNALKIRVLQRKSPQGFSKDNPISVKAFFGKVRLGLCISKVKFS